MWRRAFLSLLGGAAGLAATSQPAVPQQPVRPWRVGFLAPVPPTWAMLKTFSTALREHGLVEGQNISMQIRWPDGPFVQHPDVVADLIAGKVDVIVAWTSASVVAARRATSSIPIVMTSVGDAVAFGFVQSLARPNGNITGVSNVAQDLSGKIVELLVEIAPRIRRLGLVHRLANPGSDARVQETDQAVRLLGLELKTVGSGPSDQIEHALQELTRAGVDAVIFAPDPLWISHRTRIAEFALQAGWPTAFQRRESVEAGGLLSYGPSLADQMRKAAFYVDRILKGVKPADLPVQQPTRFELTINLKTAKALGLTVSPMLLARADEAIE